MAKPGIPGNFLPPESTYVDDHTLLLHDAANPGNYPVTSSGRTQLPDARRNYREVAVQSVDGGKWTRLFPTNLLSV